jgi:hypothetical protein
MGRKQGIRPRQTFLPITLLVICVVVTNSYATDAPDAEVLPQIQQQLLKLKQDEKNERRRMSDDEELIRALEKRLNQLDATNHQLNQTSSQLEITNHHLQDSTAEQIKALQQQVSSASSSAEFDTWMSHYLGTHQFTVVGDAAGGFIYNHRTSQNTFSLTFQPIILYRPTDWILFEGSIAASLPTGSAASFSLPVATAQIFLNDYMDLVAGIFDQPFGDWYEAQSPLWVNRLITAPLLYGAEPLIPPTDIGIQLRGSTQWGLLGQDVDYTTWIANGPSFDTTLPQPVVGQTLNPQNNIATNTNGRAYGARLRVYPLPLDYNLGRLELGASTYNGKWLNSFWLNSWGVDFAYLKKDFQARGEWVQTYRQMPTGSPADNRQGWYLQVGYFLQDLPPTHLSETLDKTLRRLELVTRYSGVDQSAIVSNEITTDPGIGFNGSPSIFSPHAREVALGLDYWIEPSIVWQNEFDLELPAAGGTITTFNGSTPTNAPAGATPNDQAILTQLAIGF